jgi:hypothetical protein
MVQGTFRAPKLSNKRHTPLNVGGYTGGKCGQETVAADQYARHIRPQDKPHPVECLVGAAHPEPGIS